MCNHIWHRHVDVNQQGEQAAGASETLHTHMTLFTTPICSRRDLAQSEKITQLITAMTASDMRPLNFVEGKSIHPKVSQMDFARTLCRGAKLSHSDWIATVTEECNKPFQMALVIYSIYFRTMFNLIYKHLQNLVF